MSVLKVSDTLHDFSMKAHWSSGITRQGVERMNNFRLIPTRVTSFFLYLFCSSLFFYYLCGQNE